MTYELPNEVAEAAWDMAFPGLPDGIGFEESKRRARAAAQVGWDAAAAYFERLGAEKMREAAAVAAKEYARNVINDPKYGHSLDWVAVNLGRGGEHVIRALPLPPQTTTTTEEATK